MVLEVADIAVAEGQEAAFVDAYRRARAQIAGAEGVGAIRMTQSLETPTRFVLLVEWTSVEDHERFRASPAFGEWRALIGSHFAGPPHVEHVVDVPAEG